MKTPALATVLCFILTLIVAVPGFAARDWQQGTLVETERSKVNSGATTTSNTNGDVKQKGNKTGYSENTTRTTSDNSETYQIYTIESGNKVYVVSEHLLFPWSKAANVSVGGAVKFAIDKNKMIILDDNEKEHKATITSVRMKTGG